MADLANERGITLADFPETTASRLRSVLGERVSVRNPLDYHTYIWGEEAALTECFAAFLGSGSDCHLLVLDFPEPTDATVTSSRSPSGRSWRRTETPACERAW
ncbi:MAG: hypothetical protein WKF73_15500 [Nocardioidaceae bacterium]